MISNELIEYYERLVREPGHFGDENRHLQAYRSDLRDQWEKRAILRELRYRSGIPVCSGEVDCLEAPSSHCMHGNHPTCLEHTDSCFLCVPPAAK